MEHQCGQQNILLTIMTDLAAQILFTLASGHALLFSAFLTHGFGFYSDL